MRLKKILKQKDISQRKLSQMSNITNQDLNQALNGKKPFFPAWRKRISEALNIPESELFPEYEKKEA